MLAMCGYGIDEYVVDEEFRIGIITHTLSLYMLLLKIVGVETVFAAATASLQTPG